MSVTVSAPLGALRVTGARSVPVASNPAPTKTAADPISVRVASDAGSLASATSAVPFDITATVSLPAHAHVEQSTALSVRELTRPTTSGTVDALIFPRARQSDGSTRDFDGVTLLTRMERAFPTQIVTLVANTNIAPLADGSFARPRQVIEYVFAQWSNEFPWFTYAAVPELRTRVPNITDPIDYVNPDDWEAAWGGIPTRLITVTQDEDRTKSMLMMLEDLLSPFPGTQYYQNSLGQLVIRALYGPDADAPGSAHVTFTNSDVRTITAGEPSASAIVNRATASVDRYQPVASASVMEPSYVQFINERLRDASVPPMLAPANFLQPVPDDRSDLTIGNGESLGRRDWKLGAGVVLSDDATAIYLEQTDGAPLITAACNEYIVSSGALLQSPAVTVDILAAIPLDGTQVLAFGARTGANYVSTTSYYVNFYARYIPDRRLVRLDPWAVRLYVPPIAPYPERVAQFEFTLNGISSAYVVNGTESVTYGNTSDGDSLPNGSGGNAIADSQAAYGLLEARISVRGYADFPNTALRNVAQGYVLENMTPKATRDVSLTHRGSVLVTFDDRGRRVELPDASEGVLTGVEYAYDMNALSVEKRVRVEELIPGAPGEIDPDPTPYLFLDDNTFWLNDDGTISEPA